MLNIRMSRTPVEGSPVPKVELCSDRQEFGWLFTEERQSLGEIDRSRDRLGTLRHCDIHFINEQNSQELQISHSLRICLFTEGTVGAGFLLLHFHTQSAQSLPVVSEFLSVRRFLSPGCTSWVPGACFCIHTQNQRNLYRWDLNSWRLPDAPFYRAAHRGCRSLAPVFTHRISASLPLGSEFLVVRRFLPLGCTSWVPCACSCIHTQNQRFHTQNRRNLYRWHPNSWRSDASCRQVAHRR